MAKQRLTLTVILLSYFMILLDNSIIFTGIPSIQHDLHLSTTELAWVQDAYTLVFGGLLLLGSRAGDILGRRRVFTAGLAIFSIASLLVGLSQSAVWIIAARALQGIGAAIVAPSALSLLTASFPEGRERSRAIALYGATAGIGASVGMLIGGAFAHWASWRGGFFINVPIGFLMMILAPRALTETPAKPGRLDIVGALCATLGVGSLVYATMTSTNHGWESATTLVPLVASLVLLGALIWNESRVADPIMPLRLFSSRIRSGAYGVRLLYLGAMIGFFFFLTQYLQETLGLNPLLTGAAFLPMTVVNFVVALTVPRVTQRWGQTGPMIFGVVLTTLGMGWLSLLDSGQPLWLRVFAPMLIVGAGQGLAFAPMTSLGVRGTSVSDSGAASGVLNTAHQLGMSLGLSVVVAVSSAVTGPTASIESVVRAALETGTGLLVLALTVAVVAMGRIEENYRKGRENKTGSVA
jgi:EmrB/QacA subfamily drug resistance transporter